MKKFIYLFIVLLIIMSNGIECYADVDEDLFVSKSEEVNFNINFNDKTIMAKGYIFYDTCFVDLRDFAEVLGYKYVETNCICYDYWGEERIYFGEMHKNNEIYYFIIENRKSGSYYDVKFRNFYAEKSVNGVREDVFLSEWIASASISVNNIPYVDICAIAYLFDDLGYMTKIDMDNNEVVVKRYNKAAFEQRVSEKYNVKAYSVCNGLNETYYKCIADNKYEIYSGLNYDDAKEKCQKLLEYIWGISVSEIYLKYDSLLDIYIATPKGTFLNNDKSIIPPKYDNVSPKLIIRAFDGMILYPY